MKKKLNLIIIIIVTIVISVSATVILLKNNSEKKSVEIVQEAKKKDLTIKELENRETVVECTHLIGHYKDNPVTGTIPKGAKLKFLKDSTRKTIEKLDVPGGIGESFKRVDKRMNPDSAFKGNIYPIGFSYIDKNGETKKELFTVKDLEYMFDCKLDYEDIRKEAGIPETATEEEIIGPSWRR